MKVFRVTGEICRPNFETPFKQEILADKPEHAIEKVRAEFGSRHRMKRYHIKIVEVEEIPAEQITNPVLKKMITGEDKVGEQS